MVEEQDELILEDKPESDEETVNFTEFPEGTEVVKEDSLDDEQASKLLEEIQSGKRFMDVEGHGVLYIRNPTIEENQEGNLIYAKVFNQAILAGIDPEDELTKKLVDKGILEDENSSDSEASKVRTELVKLEALVKKYDANNRSKQVKKAARELAEVRAKVYDFNMKRQRLLSNSAEARAEDVKNSFLISRVTYRDDTNERVWGAYEDYLKEDDYALIGRLTLEFLTFSYGIASNFMAEYPEVRFLEDDK